MLTCFPFTGTVLRACLGPADPRPTTVAEEPWPFLAEGILTPLRCYYHRDPHSERVHRTSRPDFYPTPTPAYRIAPAMRKRPEVSAAGLAPTNLRGPQPRWVSCYALLRGWLLLGPPPHCLRLGTPFRWHLAGT